MGHRDAPQIEEYRDENAIEAPGERACPLLAATHCEAGSCRPIPKAGKAGQQPRRMG